MKTSQEKLQSAFEYAMAHRPLVGGFPFLAECLRQAGVQHNIWSLPSTQSLYVMDNDVIVSPGNYLITDMVLVPKFNESDLVAALRADQAGKTTFPEFLVAAWNAGVISYDVDFVNRAVTYYGARGESYKESYPAVDVEGFSFE